jgi:hypothetical protein
MMGKGLEMRSGLDMVVEGDTLKNCLDRRISDGRHLPLTRYRLVSYQREEYMGWVGAIDENLVARHQPNPAILG